MRIAHVIPHLGGGGAENLVVLLACATAGHEVDVVVVNRQSSAPAEKFAVRQLANSGVRCIFLNRRPGYPGVVAATKLVWLARLREYEIIHSHLPFADALVGLVRRCAFAPFRHVVTLHNSRYAHRAWQKWLARGANFVCCGPAVRQRVNDLGPHVLTIPNGIDLARLVKPAARAEQTRAALGIPQDATLAVSVGRLREQKNYLCGLRAIALLRSELPARDVHYLICGDGPLQECLEAEARTLGIEGSVHFAGPREDVPDVLASADVYLSSSINEGLPLAVLEAFASGLPTVLSPIDEHRSIGEGMPGCMLASSNCPAAIASAIQSALAEPLSKRELQVLRRPKLEPYSIGACAAAYLDLYADLVQTPRNAVGRDAVLRAAGESS
jgi:glycosyltransferase involved in cell wall biosynthesis